MLIPLLLLVSAPSREIDMTPTRDSIMHLLKNNATDATAITIIVCVGAPPQTSIDNAPALLKELSSALQASKLTIPKSVVARSMDAKACPAGAKMQIDTHDMRGELPEARVMGSAGPVIAKTRDGTEVPLFKDSIVPEQSEIKTGPGGRCTVRLPDGTRVAVRENTQIALSALGAQASGKEPSGKSKLQIFAGSIWSRFSKAMGSHDLDVITPNAVAGVRGTDFQMAANGQDSKLAVTEGKVGINAGGEATEVPEGFAVVATKTLGPLRPLPPAPENLIPTQAKAKKDYFLRWDAVTGATSYRLELARDVGFTDVVHSPALTGTVIHVEAPAGVYYWRVFSRDALDIESSPSKLYQIEFVP